MHMHVHMYMANVVLTHVFHGTSGVSVALSLAGLSTVADSGKYIECICALLIKPPACKLRCRHLILKLISGLRTTKQILREVVSSATPTVQLTLSLHINPWSRDDTPEH
jgi:hypothetical protein